ncbi:hypothetical protein HK405_000327, partial [Cladochytrium tenue]
APFWNHWPHFRKHYYQVFDRDLMRSDDPDRQLDDVSWRDEASVVVDLHRLDALMDAAFEEMAP